MSETQRLLEGLLDRKKSINRALSNYREKIEDINFNIGQLLEELALLGTIIEDSK